MREREIKKSENERGRDKEVCQPHNHMRHIVQCFQACVRSIIPVEYFK